MIFWRPSSHTHSLTDIRQHLGYDAETPSICLQNTSQDISVHQPWSIDYQPGLETVNASQARKRARQFTEPRDYTAQRSNKRHRIAAVRNVGSFRESGVISSSRAVLESCPAVPTRQHAVGSDRSNVAYGSPTPASEPAFPYQHHVPAICTLFATPHGIVLSREQLLLGSRAQSRWNECGDVIKSHIADACFDGPSVRLFQEETTLEATLFARRKECWTGWLLKATGRHIVPGRRCPLLPARMPFLSTGLRCSVMSVLEMVSSIDSTFVPHDTASLLTLTAPSLWRERCCRRCGLGSSTSRGPKYRNRQAAWFRAS